MTLCSLESNESNLGGNDVVCGTDRGASTVVTVYAQTATSERTAGSVWNSESFEVGNDHWTFEEILSGSYFVGFVSRSICHRQTESTEGQTISVAI